MTARGKSINLFLMDGEDSGRIKCTLANWTGVAYKIPRTALDLCKERGDIKQSGVYFLFGTSDETGNKDYWTEAVVFTTSNDSFGPTEISYLENRFCGLALAAKRYDVENSKEPTQGNIAEEKESKLEEFVDYAHIAGHKVFEPLVSSKSMEDIEKYSEVEEPILFFNRANHNASGRRTNEGFVIFKGSAIVPNLQKNCPNNVRKYRERYKSKIDGNNILIEDVLLSSPPAASAFIGGASLSGNIMWRTKDGITLKDLEKNE